MKRTFFESGKEVIRRKVMVVSTLLTIIFLSIMSSGSISNAAETEGYSINPEHMSTSDERLSLISDYPGHVVFDTTSGVAELDSAKARTDSLIKWVCAWVGGIIALVSLIIALVMASSHQQEQRNQALVGLAVGIIIAFAPQVVEYLLGNQ